MAAYRIKWVPPAQYHLTVFFFGKGPPVVVPDLLPCLASDAFREPAATFRPYPVYVVSFFSIFAISWICRSSNFLQGLISVTKLLSIFGNVGERKTRGLFTGIA